MRRILLTLITVAIFSVVATAQSSTVLHEPEQIDFTIYPNPAKDFVVLPQSDQIAQAILYNITGQEVKRFNLANNASRFDVSGVMRGTYLLQFINEAGAILHTTRLTKR